MSTVADVVAFLEDFAPPQLAEGWDNIGLLIGREQAEVRKLLTCLTLTPDVADEAVSENGQLVVTHHPVLFRGTKKITSSTSEGRMLLGLIENGVAVYSPHTCFDSAASGINQQLAESFGLADPQPVRPSAELEGLGSGRMGLLKRPVLFEEFLATVRTAVSAEYLEFCGSLQSTVSRVAVACGAAVDFMADAVRFGCDTFVTGEARFHSALEARAAGVNLILLGHYSSERPAVDNLAGLLDSQFADVEVFASRVEQDPLKVFPS